MKYKKSIFIWLSLITAGSLFVYGICLWTLPTCLIIREFMSGVFSGIFTSSLVSLFVTYKDYLHEERKWMLNLYNTINKVYSELNYFIYGKDYSEKLEHLNSAIRTFAEYSTINHDEVDFLRLKNKFVKEKLYEPIIYLTEIFKIIEIDLCEANRNSFESTKNIDYMLKKLGKQQQDNLDISYVLLEDLRSYVNCFLCGLTDGVYSFANYPDYKKSLMFFIEKEEEEKHSLMKRIYWNSNIIGENRVGINLTQYDNIEEMDYLLNILKEENYLSAYEKIDDFYMMNIETLVETNLVFYDISFTLKLKRYFESLKIIDDFKE